MSEAITIRPIYLETNHGLGNALRVALNNCKNELVARMDSDDVSLPYRFERQLEYIEKNLNIDVVGGNITEFIGEEENVTGQRGVPSTDKEIKTDMKKRCALNHMSVMYKKSSVIRCGGYMEWFCNEDYYLWIRMMLAGCKFANIQDNLVNVRVGDAMSARRGGWRYFRSEEELQKYMLKNRIIGFPRYVYNTAIRFVVEVMLPNSLRLRLFKFTRRQVKESHSINTNNVKKTEVKDKQVGNCASFPPFSVAMSVYGKDNPEWFDRALNSVINQTVKPNEIVIVVDGPIPDSIETVIDKYANICNSGSN